MISFLIFLQSAADAGRGFNWSSDQVRTFIMGFIATGVTTAVSILWSMRDKLGVLHRDIRGDDKNPGIIDAMAEYGRRLEAIELRNLKKDVADAIEHEMLEGQPDRRHSPPRRFRDKMADTYEHPAPDKEKRK